MLCRWQQRRVTPAPDYGVTKPQCLRYRAAMITIAVSNFWYFSYDSSLAVGGSRSI
jgi:hypothetical protein